MYWMETQRSAAKVFERRWNRLSARGSPWAALFHAVVSQEYWTAIELNLDCGPGAALFMWSFEKGKVNWRHWERLWAGSDFISWRSDTEATEKCPGGLDTLRLGLQAFKHNQKKKQKQKKLSIKQGIHIGIISPYIINTNSPTHSDQNVHLKAALQSGMKCWTLRTFQRSKARNKSH